MLTSNDVEERLGERRGVNELNSQENDQPIPSIALMEELSADIHARLWGYWEAPHQVAQPLT